eukprot:UN00605
MALRFPKEEVAKSFQTNVHNIIANKRKSRRESVCPVTEYQNKTWTCPMCTYENSNRMQCGMCNTWRTTEIRRQSESRRSENNSIGHILDHYR